VETRILLVRHGETDWNAERRWQGHADPPLNELGREQARSLAALLAGRSISAVYSSDLQRASETARIVAGSLALPVLLRERLREVDVGEWSGLTTTEIEERFPGALERRRAGGNGWELGESYEAMGERIEAALLAVAATHRAETVLAVTHGGPVRMMRRLSGVQGEEWQRVANCDVDELAVRDGRIRWLDSTRGGLHQQVQG
jgi:broad specificity phosphatase PhoE